MNYKCDDCFAPADYKAVDHRFNVTEYFCDHCVKANALDLGATVTSLANPSKGYMDYLPADGRFTEDDLWGAIAEANGMDASEIMDGDLAEWL